MCQAKNFQQVWKNSTCKSANTSVLGFKVILTILNISWSLFFGNSILSFPPCICSHLPQEAQHSAGIQQGYRSKKRCHCGLLDNTLCFQQKTAPLFRRVFVSFSFCLPNFPCISQAFFVYMVLLPLETIFLNT